MSAPFQFPVNFRCGLLSCNYFFRNWSNWFSSRVRGRCGLIWKRLEQICTSARLPKISPKCPSRGYPFVPMGFGSVPPEDSRRANARRATFSVGHSDRASFIEKKRKNNFESFRATRNLWGAPPCWHLGKDSHVSAIWGMNHALQIFSIAAWHIFSPKACVFTQYKTSILYTRESGMVVNSRLLGFRVQR